MEYRTGWREAIENNYDKDDEDNYHPYDILVRKLM
jgi:hypothetical protein